MSVTVLLAKVRNDHQYHFFKNVKNSNRQNIKIPSSPDNGHWHIIGSFSWVLGPSTGRKRIHLPNERHFV